jgi:hypothetical protein
VTPARFGQVNSLVTLASQYGIQTQHYNGVDIGVNARFGKGGLLAGGVSTGRIVANDCDIVRKYPEVAAVMTPSTVTLTSSSSTSTQFCEVTVPWTALTQIKLNGVYPLPWGTQLSAVLQNLPGVPINTSYAVSNSQVTASLGRNLGACGAAATCAATVTIPNIYTPFSKFEDRLTQLDLRFTKIVRIGRAKIQGKFDIYNILNASTVLADTTAYGPLWLKPTTVLGARLVKFGAQFDF